ncbi:hypothetical protein [Aquimarina sp. 2304DJ70-9]|uniref:hypothetical protein n=1 Tax=Aquimarina penaris TaxID=3231044 RepID=UPI0034636564
MKNILIFWFPLILYIFSCKEDNNVGGITIPDTNESAIAEVISVSVTGDENEYTFSVGIKSPDTGCNQYANWWEVISEEGNLVYRRILAHSHVNEQPFVRSGSPVTIKKDQVVYVRVHMNTSGYSDQVFKGNVETGFQKNILDKTFANQLETMRPLPSGCAF